MPENQSLVHPNNSLGVVDPRRAAVVDEARSWIGTRFHMGACTKGVAVDCGRFLASVYAECGIKVPDAKMIEDSGIIRRDWYLHTKKQLYMELLDQFTKPVDGPVTGDIAMFAPCNGIWAHSAIITTWPLVIEAGGAPRCGQRRADMHPLSAWPVTFRSPF